MADAPATVRWDPSMGALVIGGVNFVGPAMAPDNIEVMWPRVVRRDDNVTLGGVAGRLARDWLPDQKVVDLRMRVGTGKSQDGVTTYATAAAGLEANLGVLEDLCRPGLYLAHLEKPSGAAFEGNVQLELGDPEKEGGGLVRVAVTVTIIRGELLPV